MSSKFSKTECMKCEPTTTSSLPYGKNQKNFLKPAILTCLTAQMAEWYRASVSGAVDSGLISSRVKPMTLKLVFTASLLDAQHYKDSVENKPASLFVMQLGKALSWIAHLGVVDRWLATPKRARIAH